MAVRLPRFRFQHAYADGDFVIFPVHSVREPGTLGRAIVDIFRLQSGKVVEHWDGIQDATDPAEAKAANGMFGMVRKSSEHVQRRLSARNQVVGLRIK